MKAYRYVFVVIVLFIVHSSIVHAEPTQRKWIDMHGYFMAQGFAQPTYRQNVPTNQLTTITPLVAVETGANLVIDASQAKYYFPIDPDPKKFSSVAELKAFMIDTFGSGVSVPWEGARGLYEWIGASYFFDPNPGVTYRVVDPFLATLGGTKGIVYIDGKPVCVDTDGECDTEYASYFEPVGEMTAPTHLDHCGNFYEDTRVCVRHHSFFNSVNLIFGQYIRHGVNVRFTTWAAYPWSQLTANFDIIGSPVGTLFPPTSGPATAVGENFVESSWYCLFNCIDVERHSDLICGRSSVTDPDVNGERITGNGPRNNPSVGRCPG